MKPSWKKTCGLLLTLLLGVMSIGIAPAFAAGEVSLFTPYMNISVPPGETIKYNIDVINNTSAQQRVAFRIIAPEGWNTELTSGGWKIEELGVEGDGQRTVSLDVEVPLKVDKGEYQVTVEAIGMATLPLKITISEQGTYRTELSSEQPNMQGHANSTFNFSLDLRNRTAEDQLYALTADVPQGWVAIFKVDNQQVTSTQVEANQSQKIQVEIDPPEGVKADTYKIPVRAANGATSAETELEVVITGSYGLQLTTPTGLLSAEVTTGKSTKVELEVVNSGSADLRNITMDYNSPPGWDVTFEPNVVDVLPAGETAKVIATIQSSDKAIPGDYVTQLTARTPEVTANANFRVAVKTSMLWGWLGIFIIAIVIGGISYLFRKYGRR